MKNKVLFIAEAGVNHNGDMVLAKKLVDLAAEAGADVVKFQTFKSENLVTISAKMADYQVQNTQKIESQLDMLKKLELTEKDFIELQTYCQTKRIKFLSTGFDLDSLNFLQTLNMGLWKVPSGEITNLPYLQFLAAQKDPVILSTGMSYLDEIKAAVQVLTSKGLTKDQITVLHCNTDYPTPFEDVNLRAMNTIQQELGVQVGYSDHTEGIEVSLAAVALGATVIEKHFTLDKKLPGPDHKASLDPQEFKMLIRTLRHVEKCLGSAIKAPSKGELKNRAIVRKSIVAGKTIKKGEMLTLNNLTIKRPGSGINPMLLETVLNQPAKRDYDIDELIE